MTAADFKITLNRAIEKTGVDRVKVRHNAHLLSDSGPSYISNELEVFLETQQIEHTRGALFHPMTQGKIERYHQSKNNMVNLQGYCFTGELENEIDRSVEY